MAEDSMPKAYGAAIDVGNVSQCNGYSSPRFSWCNLVLDEEPCLLAHRSCAIKFHSTFSHASLPNESESPFPRSFYGNKFS